MHARANKPTLRTEEQLVDDTLAWLALQIRAHVAQFGTQGLATALIEILTLGSQIIADTALHRWECSLDVFALTPRQYAAKRSEFERKYLLESLEQAYERLQGANTETARILRAALKPMMILHGRLPDDWCQSPKEEPELAARHPIAKGR
jgi:hypothetical protein